MRHAGLESLALAATVLMAGGSLPAGSARAAEPVGQICADCHGKDGASTESDVPIIGGQSAQYLSDALDDYREQKRPCPESKYRSGDKRRPATTMCRVAGDLAPRDAAEVTRTLSDKPFVRARQPFDAAKAAIGKKVHELRCEKCHADGGSSKADDSGILAGQWLKYLEQAFKEVSEGSRPVPKKMKPKFDELSPADREALLQYYASFQ